MIGIVTVVLGKKPSRSSAQHWHNIRHCHCIPNLEVCCPVLMSTRFFSNFIEFPQHFQFAKMGHVRLSYGLAWPWRVISHLPLFK